VNCAASALLPPLFFATSRMRLPSETLRSQKPTAARRSDKRELPVS